MFNFDTVIYSVDFKVLAESGNYEHWKYSVAYTENLSHWPYLSNTAIAHFEVKPDAKNELFFINSVHQTCFLRGYLCRKLLEFKNESEN